MISTILVQFQTMNSFPKFSKKLLSLAFNLTRLLTLCLLLFILLAGWIFHSTETIRLKLRNNLILDLDRGEVNSLILLNLSAAFDTVDHSILLIRLQNWFGLDSLSLDWFLLYLSSRSQEVSINDFISAFSTLSCCVPPRFLTWPTPFHSIYNSSWLGDHKKIPQISFVRWWHPALSLLQMLLYLLKHLPTLSLKFSPGWTWTNCF